MSSIIMGLDRNNKSPCGFAFVEYYLHSEAVACMRYISGTKLDERIIRCDLDPGYKEGRQFGRGKSGGQVRDEFRQEYDSGRGKPWRTIDADYRWMGTSTSGGRAASRRAGSSTFTDAIRHIRIVGWWIGNGGCRCTEGRRARARG
jgi:RNA recognition motif-containing protein